MNVLSGRPSRWRWNPVEELWEVDQGAGWKTSKVMEQARYAAALPKGGERVDWDKTKHEPHWKAEAWVVENDLKLTLAEELAKPMRKQRSDKGKKRGKRKEKA